MTYGELVHTIFSEFVAGAKMEDEVPGHVLHPGELPRVEAIDYLQGKGVGKDE